MYRLGMDIGGTKIRIGIVRYENETLTVCAQRRLDVSEIREICSELCAAVSELCTEAGIPVSALVSCGVGIPGTVTGDGKRILKAPNIALLEECFADRLSDALGMPVRLVQDSRAAAWGEFLCGGGKGMESVICVTLGTGIGTGIVLGGRIYHGALGAAGELGHIPLVKNGRVCGCGKRGCLEKYCAGGGLDLTARELFGGDKSARDLFLAARNGNIDATQAIGDAVETLGRAIVAAVNLFSPNAVLFSGGMSEEADFLKPLISYIKENCYVGASLPTVEKAALGDLAPLVGAALCDFRE